MSCTLSCNVHGVHGVHGVRRTTVRDITVMYCKERYMENVPVLEPKIQLSHRRDRVTLWLQGLNTHNKALNMHGYTDRRLFFSLPYFGFRTSVSALQRFPLTPQCGVSLSMQTEQNRAVMMCIAYGSKLFQGGVAKVYMTHVVSRGVWGHAHRITLHRLCHHRGHIV